MLNDLLKQIDRILKYPQISLVYSVNYCVCVLQDHPEQGVLYLVRGLLNMVQDYTWEDNSDAKVRVYISALPLLAAMSQENYLYTIPKGTHTPFLNLYSGD